MAYKADNPNHTKRPQERRGLLVSGDIKPRYHLRLQVITHNHYVHDALYQTKRSHPLPNMINFLYDMLDAS